MPRDFDLIVIGAGPAGCEASLAAARRGRHALCLTINLDSIALHPASPRIASGRTDPRAHLLHELQQLGGALPGLLERDGATAASPAGDVIIDRRRLSLFYKEELENANGVELRQSLATEVVRTDEGWQVETRFGERFCAPAAVIAAGTFLDGTIDEAGVSAPGGRHGEIPARSLARSLQSLGLRFTRAGATAFPRLDGRSLQPGPTLFPDGLQLCELYADGREPAGSRLRQLQALRTEPLLAEAWLTRSLYHSHHLLLEHGQVTEALQCRKLPRLYFAGRSAGSCNYIEAAALGLIAGGNALLLPEAGAGILTGKYGLATELCRRIAGQEYRPVTVRREPPGC